MTHPPSQDRQDWPSGDLETLGACPYCQARPRQRLFAGLRDYAFQVAPGTWTLWRCQGCRAAYLDPRPTPASIGRAYSRYYTHAAPAGHGLEGGGSPLRRLLTASLVGWLNRQYGHQLPAGRAAAAPLSALFPGSRRSVSHVIRHLPAPGRPGAQLLDVGCGGGDFLRLAAELGYQAVGLDFDPQAVSRGRAQGLDIHQGGFPGSGLAPGSFAQITMSHVLEHLHDPLGAVREAYQLLEPGGRLWLTQPNLGAVGLEQFGPYWRGLEPPRHLTLVDCPRMRQLLREAGFQRIQLLDPVPVAGFFYRQSLCQQQGLDPNGGDGPNGWGLDWDVRVRDADAVAASDPSRAENMTFVAYKPG